MARAQLVLGLCERFGCLPSALLAEDARMLRMLKIEALVRRDEGGEEIDG